MLETDAARRFAELLLTDEAVHARAEVDVRRQ
jgi:hypothetical protein